MLMSGILAHFLCYMVCVVHTHGEYMEHGEYTHETGTNISVPMSKWLCTPLLLVKSKFYLKIKA